nr:unnamed protein product [Callosobruchus analis]
MLKANTQITTLILNKNFQMETTFKPIKKSPHLVISMVKVDINGQEIPQRVTAELPLII